MELPCTIFGIQLLRSEQNDERSVATGSNQGTGSW